MVKSLTRKQALKMGLSKKKSYISNNYKINEMNEMNDINYEDDINEMNYDENKNLLWPSYHCYPTHNMNMMGQKMSGKMGQKMNGKMGQKMSGKMGQKMKGKKL